MISKDEVKHIARLARLGLSEKEIQKMQKELSLILDYFEKLREIDISGIKPYTHAIKTENVTREDKTEKELETKTQKLLKLVPKTKEGYVKTKQVL